MKRQKAYLFDHPKNIKRVLYILYGCCALLLVLDFVIHRHVSHNWESLWGFYPLFGFVGCVILVFIATWMRRFVKRDEDYYDKHNKQHKNPIKKPPSSSENRLSIKAEDPHVDD